MTYITAVEMTQFLQIGQYYCTLVQYHEITFRHPPLLLLQKQVEVDKSKWQWVFRVLY